VPGVILPHQAAGSAAGWGLFDFRTVAATTDPAAGGTAVVTLPQLAFDELWLIDHAVVSCTSVAGTDVRWYSDSPTPANLLDGSSSGNFDVADWPAGLQLQPGTSLVAVWSGCDDGAVGTLTVQARIMRRAG